MKDCCVQIRPLMRPDELSFNKVFRPSALRNVTCVDVRRTPFITKHYLFGLQTQCAYLQIQVSYIVH